MMGVRPGEAVTGAAGARSSDCPEWPSPPPPPAPPPSALSSETPSHLATASPCSPTSPSAGANDIAVITLSATFGTNTVASTTANVRLIRATRGTLAALAFTTTQVFETHLVNPSATISSAALGINTRSLQDTTNTVTTNLMPALALSPGERRRRVGAAGQGRLQDLQGAPGGPGPAGRPRSPGPGRPPPRLRVTPRPSASNQTRPPPCRAPQQRPISGPVMLLPQHHGSSTVPGRAQPEHGGPADRGNGAVTQGFALARS